MPRRPTERGGYILGCLQGALRRGAPFSFGSLTAVTLGILPGPIVMRFPIFPPHRAGRIRLCLLTCLLALIATPLRLDRLVRALTYDKHEGDVLFQSLPSCELVRAIEGITASPWSHCGVLFRRDRSWMVIEALGSVSETPYWLWVIRGRGAAMAAFRISDVTSDELDHVASSARRFLGRPYDFRYAPGDDEMYCSELVYRAFEDGCGVRLGSWERLGDLNWKPFEGFIHEMEAGPLPLERRMITPVGLTRSPRMIRVFPAAGRLPPSIASIPPG